MALSHAADIKPGSKHEPEHEPKQSNLRQGEAKQGEAKHGEAKQREPKPELSKQAHNGGPQSRHEFRHEGDAAGVAASEAAAAIVQPPPAVAPAASSTPSDLAPTSSSGFPKDELRRLGYMTVGPIAAGAFSQVVRARELSTSREVAVKTYAMRCKGGRHPGVSPADVRKEIECLEQLQASAHEGIANLVATHEGLHGSCHVILEVCSGGSLLRHLQKLGGRTGMAEAPAATLVAQVGAALAHMHALGVTHRDVKPANLVFDSAAKERLRLVDFGFAAIHRGPADAQPRRLHTLCGTPGYLAPEIVRAGGVRSGIGSSKAGYLGPPVDVWALGCLTYELTHNKPPFRAESIASLNVRILKGNHDECSTKLSKEGRAIIRRLLTVDVAERPSARHATEIVREAYALDGAGSRETSHSASCSSLGRQSRASKDWLTGC